MPLKLSLTKGERFVVNGAVIKNDGPDTSLVFENRAHILRQKDIMTNDDANSPARRVYLALQCAYMFPHKKDEYLGLFTNFLNEFVAACPSTRPIAEEIEQFVAEDKIYKALKHTQKLIAHQAKVLKSLEAGVDVATKDMDQEPPSDGAEKAGADRHAEAD